MGTDIGTPSVQTGFTKDIYLTLEQASGDGATEATIKVFIKPMIVWLWIGGGLMAIGTVLAAFPGSAAGDCPRRRSARRSRSTTRPHPRPARPSAPRRPRWTRSVSDTITDAAVTTPTTDHGDGDDGGSGRRRIAPFIALAVAVLLGALFVVLAGSDPASDEAIDSSLIGTPAPGATGDLLDGGTFDLSRRKGSWVVLNFFDPTCVPCVEEHPELVAFAAQQASLADGAELYTVINRSVSPGGGTDDDVQAFFDERGGDWPVVRDPDGGISVAFGVSQVPETWIVDPDGVVRVRFAGQITAEGVGTTLQQLREQRNG